MRQLLIMLALGSMAGCEQPERVAANATANPAPDTNSAQSVDPNVRWMADQDVIPTYPPPPAGAAPADNTPAPH
jgi:hypothetical protein